MKSRSKILTTIFSLLFIGILSSYNSVKKDNILSKEEINSLLFMLEEEKMAFDVYSLMDEKWGTMQFARIKQSEIMHINAVKDILDKNNIRYNLLENGKFNDKNLQKLYNELTAQGNKSEIEALKAGAKIEDIDIYDLIRLKKETKNEEIISLYNFLECGSRNHLRAFSRVLEMNNYSYKPEFISEKDYASILNDAQERCGQLLVRMGKGMEKGSGNQNGKSMNCAGGENLNCPMKQPELKGQYGKRMECDPLPEPGCGMCK